MNLVSPQFNAELQCLAALRQSRADFFDKLVDDAERWRGEKGEPDLTREERKLLRNEGTAQIAEFFFVLREGGLSTPEALSDFLNRHNADMQHLLETCERGYTRFGLSAARIKEAIFKPHQIDLILHESHGEKTTFDQRSIAKILTQVMSFESCRTLLILLANVGLLQRRDFRSMVLISSNGRHEDLFKEHLGFIVKSVSAHGSVKG